MHLVKLAVGIESLDHFRERLAARIKGQRGRNAGTFMHVTRNRPKRADEVLAGGSLYWVIKGKIAARTRIVALEELTIPDEGPHCGIRMEAKLVPVVPRPRRPHQGWRYLEAADAPPDLKDVGKGAAELPPELVAELRELGLI